MQGNIEIPKGTFKGKGKEKVGKGYGRADRGWKVVCW